MRKNLIHFLNHDFDYLLILCGDQLYRMDFRKMIAQHIETGRGGDDRDDSGFAARSLQSLGIMQIDDDRRITRFVEKPKEDAVQDTSGCRRSGIRNWGSQGTQECFLASMGIYVFDRDVLVRTAGQRSTPTSANISFPEPLALHRVYAYIFQDYWEDIGTIRAFFEANLDLTAELPRFNFFDMLAPDLQPPALAARRRKSTGRTSTMLSFATGASLLALRSAIRSSASAAMWGLAAASCARS